MKTLTQVLINKSEAARRGYFDCYSWHKALWRSFIEEDTSRHTLSEATGQAGNPNQRSFLFRVDEENDHFKILILSRSRPRVQAWGIWQSKSISSAFLSHRSYQFQIKANPTIRRLSDRRRLGIYGREKLQAWIERKAQQNGFSISMKSLTIESPINEVFMRNQKQGKHVAVEFKGRLQVVDRSLFKKAFESGIGPAKSFGFGLLMLKPEAQFLNRCRPMGEKATRTIRTS